MTRAVRAPFFAFALGLLALGSSTAPPSVSAAPRLSPECLRLLARSELAESAGDGAEAIAWAESLVTVDPRSSFGCSRLATLHEAMGQDIEALEWGSRALARDSLNLEAAMLVARMHLRAGTSEIAAQVLTPPLRQLGVPPEAYALRALANQLSHRYDAALADLERTDMLLPDFAWIATGILGLALEDGRLTEASQALQLALELRPDDPRVLHLGVSLAQRIEDPVLEETLLRTLATQSIARPNDVAAYGSFLVRTRKGAAFKQLLAWSEGNGLMRQADLRVETGHSLVREGYYEQALETVRPLKKDPRAVPVRARAYVSLGEERKALECYRQLIPGRSLSREESLVVAYLEIRVGDRVRGVETLERARASRLDTPRQVLAASLCYSLLGYPDEAVALIRDSATRGISSPSVFEELGSAASVLGDSLVAQWAFERMRELGKETSECLYFLASAELSQGREDHAVTTLERAIRLDAKNGRALLLLGRVQYDRGQLELARETLRAAAACPESAYEANRSLAKVCRSLKLESEAREAESKARGGRPRTSPGLTLFQGR